MNAEIITIGDEILIGQIIDTNSSWLGQELNHIGVRVVRRASVSDDREAILAALHEAQSRAQIIIITGGLGPTKDDITKHTLASFFNDTLVMNEPVLEWVTKIFSRRNLPMLESNNQQAMVPSKCEVLFNHHGTAPGMWFDTGEHVFISLPGVPFEMKGIMEQYGLPKLKSRFKTPIITHRTIQTTGIGESFLAKKIAAWEDALPPQIRLAYLPSVGQVRLRLSAYEDASLKLETLINEQVAQLYNIAGEYIYGEADTTLQQAVGQLLKSQQATLSTAESCTGGYLSHLITSVPGSSAYYKGSIISYANEIKTSELGIDSEILRTHGAVSEACVKQMAESVRRKLNTDYAIATSGIAGPDGGTADKPVGTVWIAVSSASVTNAKCYQMGDHRERTIHRTALEGLDMLRRMLSGLRMM